MRRLSTAARLALIALVTPVLASCQLHWTYAAPVPSTPRTEVVNRPFEDVWSGVVAWFAGNNVTIEKIEKPSGLVTAKYAVPVRAGLIDIGSLEVHNSMDDPVISRFATINVLARPIPEGRTEVTVNVFGSFVAVAHERWQGLPRHFEGGGVSTGEVESAILRALRQ